MGLTLLLSLALLPFLLPDDPAPGLLHSRDDARRLDCERVGTAAGSRRFPGRVTPDAPRGELIERSAVICRERMMRPGLREARDEAILSTLSDRATELAELASSRHTELAGRTWLVDVHYPSAEVSAKIALATRDAMVRGGLSVSDRTPLLTAADVEIITRMSPDEAWPAACQRYAASGSLGDDDALLAVVTRDPRETILHAGLCSRGGWLWMQ